MCGPLLQVTGPSTLACTSLWAAPGTAATAGTGTTATSTRGGAWTEPPPWWRAGSLHSTVGGVSAQGNNSEALLKDTANLSLSVADTPSQRVQFLLGTEDDDEEHIPHDLFTEMDEICVRDGEDSEWRESARC